MSVRLQTIAADRNSYHGGSLTFYTWWNTETAPWLILPSVSPPLVSDLLLNLNLWSTGLKPCICLTENGDRMITHLFEAMGFIRLNMLRHTSVIRIPRISELQNTTHHCQSPPNQACSNLLLSSCSDFKFTKMHFDSGRHFSSIILQSLGTFDLR